MWIQCLKRKDSRLHVCPLGWPPSCLIPRLGYTCFVLNPRVVQSLSCVRLFVTPGTAACQASLPLTISWSLLKLMSFESVVPPNPSHPLSPSSPPARIFQSGIHFCVLPGAGYSGCERGSLPLLLWFGTHSLSGRGSNLLTSVCFSLGPSRPHLSLPSAELLSSPTPDACSPHLLWSLGGTTELGCDVKGALWTHAVQWVRTVRLIFLSYQSSLVTPPLSPSGLPSVCKTGPKILSLCDT